jgi:hypothetical protein
LKLVWFYFSVPILTGPHGSIEQKFQTGQEIINQVDGFKVPYKGPIGDKGTKRQELISWFGEFVILLWGTPNKYERIIQSLY